METGAGPRRVQLSRRKGWKMPANILKDRPDLLADYLAKIAEIRRDSDTQPQAGDAKQGSARE